MRAPLSVLIALLLSTSATAFEPQNSTWSAESGPIEYHLHPEGSDDIDDGSDLDAVRGAFERWNCVGGTSLRFRESAEPGVRSDILGDGRNNVFWDERNEFGLGPATLGITSFAPAGSENNPAVRNAAIIIFNGFDHAWSTSDNPGQLTDVESIAVHEIGHMLGLGHPCPADDNCPEVSVMAPIYPGGLLRTLRADDIEGARFLYPTDDESECTGPFREGEFCSCDGDCVGELICSPDPQSGANTCTQACSTDDTTCPPAFACVLGVSSPGAPKPGVCVNTAGLPRPAGAVCGNDRDCGEGICLPAAPVERTICRVSCESVADCEGEGYGCIEGFCLLDERGIECPDQPPDCGCATAGTGTGGPATLALMLAILLALNRGFRFGVKAVRGL